MICTERLGWGGRGGAGQTRTHFDIDAIPREVKRVESFLGLRIGRIAFKSVTKDYEDYQSIIHIF
jgi:hypothetical protein